MQKDQAAPGAAMAHRCVCVCVWWFGLVLRIWATTAVMDLSSGRGSGLPSRQDSKGAAVVKSKLYSTRTRRSGSVCSPAGVLPLVPVCVGL